MKKTLLFTAIAAFTAFGAFAQNYYYYVQKTGTSADYNLGTLGTAIIPQGSNDVLSAATNIGFPFNFYGSAVTQYKASDNGYITFDVTETASPSTNTTLPSIAAPKNAIFAFWDAFEFKVLPAPNQLVKTEVRSWTYGTSPNQVHVIQWFTPVREGGGVNVAYFAIRLYEGGDFDVIYNYAINGWSGTIGAQDATGVTGIKAASSPASEFPNLINGWNNSTDLIYKFVYGTQPAIDASVTKLSMFQYAVVNTNATIAGTLANYGSTAITSFDLNYSVDGGATVTQSKTGLNIAPSGGVYGFSHSTAYIPATTGAKSVKVWASNINGTVDGNTVNDDKTMVLDILQQFGSRRILLEGFSSSTCSPCKPGNEIVHAILAGRDHSQYTNIKYQEYFPGLGDPYTTLESIARMEYYSVNAIPALEIDGGWNGNSNNFTDAEFDQYLSVPAILDIAATHTINFHTVNVNVTITPYANIPAGAKLHIAIMEGTTSANKKSNGETEFFHVMKKMVPSSNGTTMSAMTAGAPVTVPTKSFAFPGGYKLPVNARPASNVYPSGTNFTGINLATQHSIEEFSDLEVVVFLQDNTTKQVYNSNWSDGSFLGVNRNPASVNSLGLYPNPASNSIILDFSLTANENVSIEVIDVLGKVVKSENIGGLESGDHSIVLNTTDLNNGVYYLNLKSNGSVTTQKFVIAK